MSDRKDHRWNVVLAALVGLFAFVLVRTAWLSDDAYITFRTVDNFVNGYGLRWNVAERVQTYTHPLWLMLVTVPYAITREAYFTPIVLQMILAMTTVAILALKVAGDVRTAGAAVLFLICSKAFVEYSTSGLENPVTHLLLILFLAAFWRLRGDRRAVTLWLLASLLMLTRIDAGLLVIPALIVEWRSGDRRARWRSAAIGLGPLFAWELFSVVYYGFPFPNTAYAKLQTGIASATLMKQGLLYFADGLKQDPVTLLVTVSVSAAALAFHRKTAWPIVAGISLYYLYIVRIGGDFMTGRFLSAPLLCAVALFAHLAWPRLNRLMPAFAAIVIVLGMFKTTRPPLTSNSTTFILSARDGMGISGVADERAFYYRYTGLLRWTRAIPLPHYGQEVRGRAARAEGRAVRVESSVGLFGFFAGPEVHIVDPLGVGDALLARQPALPGWRIGHFQRTIPEGYVPSIETGENKIYDSTMALQYERLKTVTQGPLWTRRRWRVIRQLNLGW